MKISLLKQRVLAAAQDRNGNVAMLFGFAIIPLLLGVGLAVDYGRAMLVRERMAEAADSAALALGSWTGLSQAEMKTKAQQYFNANYPPDQIGTVGAVDVVASGDNITVSVKGTVPTTFMKLGNINSVNVAAASTINKKQRNIELVLVLDTTGSMGSGGKLSAMQNAAKKMVQTLFNGQTTSTTLKVGVVPFAAAVNVGPNRIASNPEWFDLNTYTTANASADPVAFEDLDKTTGISAYNLYHNSGKATALKSENWAGCVRERSANNNTTYELTDAAPSSGDAASRWVPYFAPDEPDKASNTTFTNNYMCDNPSKCSSGNSTTVPSATCVTGTSDNDKRQCYTAKYKAATVSGGEGPDYNCPPAPITAMTNTASTVNSAIDALQAKGNTVIPTGLLWGWRVISPTAPFTEGSAYNDEKWVKSIVLLTDGENEVSGGDNGFNKSVYNAFGYAKNGHLGNTSGSNAEATIDSKTLTVCNAIKAKGIMLYTIGFQVSSASQTLLKNCAGTDQQGNKLFYNSPSNDQLASIFQDIARGLGELRIAQ